MIDLHSVFLWVILKIKGIIVCFAIEYCVVAIFKSYKQIKPSPKPYKIVELGHLTDFCVNIPRLFVLKLYFKPVMSIIQQQQSMRTHTLQRQPPTPTPGTRTKLSTNIDNERSQTIDTFYQQPSMKTKTYSFMDLPEQSLNDFCNKIHEVHALLNIGKKITDPNVLMLNSTQKEMVEMIIDNNKHSTDQKSKFLRQRAGKYIKLLWKTDKFNDSIVQVQIKREKEPHYASPIHNIKKPKVSTDLLLSPRSNRTERSLSTRIRIKNRGEIEKQVNPQESSRAKRMNSEDHKFSNVRLGKYDKSKKQEKEKSFEIDLTKNIAWKTMNTTKNFENMLKILKKEE